MRTLQGVHRAFRALTVVFPYVSSSIKDNLLIFKNKAAWILNIFFKNPKLTEFKIGLLQRMSLL